MPAHARLPAPALLLLLLAATAQAVHAPAPPALFAAFLHPPTILVHGSLPTAAAGWWPAFAQPQPALRLSDEGGAEAAEAAPPPTATAYALALLPSSPNATHLLVSARRSPASPWLTLAAVVVGTAEVENGPAVVRLDVRSWPWQGPRQPHGLATAALGAFFGSAIAWRAAQRAKHGGPAVWARVGSRLEKVG